jgi:hypothetical protein
VITVSPPAGRDSSVGDQALAWMTIETESDRLTVGHPVIWRLVAHPPTRCFHDHLGVLGGTVCPLTARHAGRSVHRSGHTETIKRSFITSGCQAQISFVYSLTFSAESLLAIAR